MKPVLPPPIGPWTHEHWLGAVTVLAIFAGFALTFWPGWARLLAIFP